MTAHPPKDRGGFTLVELAVVVMIVALLAAIAMPNLQRAIVKARATAAIAELQVIRVAVLNYLGDYHTYPPDRNRGVIPPRLDAYLPENFSFSTEYYVIDYDNWAPTQGFIGLTIITADTIIGGAMIDILGDNTWSNGKEKFTWVIDWTEG